MKNWKLTGIIKAILLAMFSAALFIAPIGADSPQGIGSAVLMPLIVGSFMLPLALKMSGFIFNLEVVKPYWNDNPFKFKRPLIFFQFMAYFYLCIGLSSMIGTAVKYGFFSVFGLSMISIGFGMLIGIYLSLKWQTKAKAKEAGEASLNRRQ